MKNQILLWLVFTFLIIPTGAYSQEIEIDYNRDRNTITISNPLFERVLKIDIENSAFYTSGFKDRRNDYEYWRQGNDEFMFHLDGKKISGNKQDKQFTFLDHIIQDGEHQSKILKVHLKGLSNTAARETELFIYYQYIRIWPA
ncbi:MAG: hypothetical protein DRJ13_11930 [Bacteroidetes bacterium]|nr:MAG: hypothetical protein DRJ13_11930 [Bacteroidota bacterium]